ncbi:MAG: hypothetical protein GIX03_05675 [Candidatus Eremiobacteraeota bacterium]|nr:hypothetical protein [Candidatus Eremiobacteraeota bacterium]MBC5802487.1 hypothetical protein [Candidatus Eremiobacteraeota bacterium]
MHVFGATGVVRFELRRGGSVRMIDIEGRFPARDIRRAASAVEKNYDTLLTFWIYYHGKPYQH